MAAFQRAKKFLAEMEQRIWAPETLCAHDDVSIWKLLGLLRV